MSLYFRFVDWLEKIQLPCLFMSLSDIGCPGCGIQRAFIALLRGDFIASLKLYPALIPTIIMLILLVVHIFYPLKRGATMLLSLFILNVVIMVTTYIYKLIV